MGISPVKLQKLQEMISSGESHGFYLWTDWIKTRQQVLEMDHYECQRCRELHRYSKAVIVHHVKHLRDRPDLALSVFDPDTGERQLISLCRACHEEQHPERWKRPVSKKAEPLTVERWD